MSWMRAARKTPAEIGMLALAPTRRVKRARAMLLAALLLATLFAAGCNAPALQQSQRPSSGSNVGSARVPALKHIFVVPMENESQSALIGNSAAPYINSLAQQYGVAAQFYGTAHPSLPNYLEMTAGSTFGVRSDCNQCYQQQKNIVDQIEAKGLTWRAYTEDVPSACYTGGDIGGYSKHHNPFVYYDDIRNNPARCANIVPATTFASDLSANTAPNLIWYTPSVNHDMHDTGVAAGDAFLQRLVPTILDSAAYKSGPSAIFIVWDEASKFDTSGCCGGLAWGGHTLALVISTVGKHGYTSQIPYYHGSLLLTIEDAFVLGTLNDTANPATRPMADFFTSTNTGPTVTPSGTP